MWSGHSSCNIMGQANAASLPRNQTSNICHLFFFFIDNQRKEMNLTTKMKTHEFVCESGGECGYPGWHGTNIGDPFLLLLGLVSFLFFFEYNYVTYVLISHSTKDFLLTKQKGSFGYTLSSNQPYLSEQTGYK